MRVPSQIRAVSRLINCLFDRHAVLNDLDHVAYADHIVSSTSIRN